MRNALVLAKVPEIAPLEAAQVRLTRLGNVRVQQVLGAFEIPFVPCLLDQVHVGGIGLGFGLLALLRFLLARLFRSLPFAIDAIRSDRRADADDDEEKEDEDDC